VNAVVQGYAYAVVVRVGMPDPVLTDTLKNETVEAEV
jgi:hypothetical protein